MAKKTGTPTDDLTTVGGYRHKEKLSQILVDYRDAFYMIALVHEQGTYKYDCYSWLTNPAASNSTIIENIDALYRHLGAHSMGRIMDPEGLPHLFHMVCRAGMLISTYYRSATKMAYRYKPLRTKKFTKENPDSCCIPGWQITPEEIYSLSKPDPYKEIQQPEELIPLINCLLFCMTDTAYLKAYSILEQEEAFDNITRTRELIEDHLTRKEKEDLLFGDHESVADALFKQVCKLAIVTWKYRKLDYALLMEDKDKILKTPQMEVMLNRLGITF